LYVKCAVGDNIKLGSLVFNPPRNGPTLWEIGTPDRTAAEFYVPDPYPNLVNKLYLNDTINGLAQNSLPTTSFNIHHMKAIFSVFLKSISTVTGLGNTACGDVTLSYIQKMISFSQLVFLTIIRIGFMLKLPGKFCLTYRIFCNFRYEFSPLNYTDVCRLTGEGKFVPTTWQIRFKLENVIKGANYTLQLALASATNAKLEVQPFTSSIIDL